MTETTKSIEVEKQEITPTEENERTRDSSCFVPRADIYETDDQLVVVADVPGVDESSIDIALDKNILTINAYVDAAIPEGYSLLFAEYQVGDFQRTFKISDEIDREKIQASIKDGVLHLYLPKAKAAHTRKISVKAG
jgi:HSP20 family protein